jgi:hypothetical protein
MAAFNTGSREVPEKPCKREEEEEEEEEEISCHMRRLSVFDNDVLRRKFGLMRVEVTGPK